MCAIMVTSNVFHPGIWKTQKTAVIIKHSAVMRINLISTLEVISYFGGSLVQISVLRVVFYTNTG